MGKKRKMTRNRFFRLVLSRGADISKEQWLTLPQASRNYFKNQVFVLYRDIQRIRRWGEASLVSDETLPGISDRDVSSSDERRVIAEQNMKICMRALGETEEDRMKRLKYGDIHWYDYDVYPEGPGHHSDKIKIGLRTSRNKAQKKVRESLGRSREALNRMREGELERKRIKKKKKKKKGKKRRRHAITLSHVMAYKKAKEKQIREFLGE